MVITGEIEWAARLFLAVFLGFIIGFERQHHGQAAGVRTHSLVALGSALFTLVAIDAFPGEGPSRITANIVTGLGFLGAGMIIREEHKIRGLTTAAGIWSVGAMGLTIGAGLYLMGVVSGILIFLLLASERILHRDERVRKVD